MANRAKGKRKGKKTRHISLTEMASEVYSQLLAAGFVPHPGPISSHGGGGPETRITLANENSRFRIVVVHSGTQTLYVYGQVDQALLEQVLRRFVGDKLKVRNART
jgi:hypothetical protein